VWEGVKADIIAQTLEKMLVDIAAVSVGDLGVDIKAQTINKLDIDIMAQTIAELISFTKVGRCYASISSWTADPETNPTILSVNGRGVLFYYIVTSNAATGSHRVGMTVTMDGNSLISALAFETWNNLGFTPDTAPFSLLKYAADGMCVGAFVPRVPMTFDTSLELGVANPTNSQQSGVYIYAYSIL